jgi:TRAP-type C4-dicarboxylate transport system permease small subunit
MADTSGAIDGSSVPPPEDHTAMDRAMLPVRRLFRLLGLALLAVMIALPVLQVSLREVTRSSFIGAGELTRFMLICVVFITLPYVVSSGANIRMEEFTAAFPVRLQRYLKIVITATAVVAFSFAAYSVALATLRNLNNATPSLGIPYWIFFSAAFLGLLFAALECAIQFVKIVRGQELYVSFAEELPQDEVPDL